MRRTAALALPLLLLGGNAADRAYWDAAESTARWVGGAALPDSGGLVWPADPRDCETVDTSLYAGSPGPVLFFLESYRYTGDRRYLATARAGADALLSAINDENGHGLYTGVAGVGFALGEAFRITHDPKYRDGALKAVQVIQDGARNAGEGVEWSDSTDIISGGSGTGLFLLWAARELNAPSARDLAVRAGRRLIALGQTRGPGQLGWMLDATYPLELPNFSHGAAGVAYFLATLYRETHDRTFLDASLAGARYLTSIADRQGDGCLVLHDGANPKMYYLGWCHGPAGTVRLFYRLFQVTQDPAWMDWARRSAEGAAAAGAPERAVIPGEWNNVSLCCGTAGQAQFFLSMYRLTKERRYLDLASRGTALLLAKASTGPDGARWIQAENRKQPDQVMAQTGLMQGASGIGLWLLHAAAFRDGRELPMIVLPDDPFEF
jgi:lantibiotic modifying enzyme